METLDNKPSGPVQVTLRPHGPLVIAGDFEVTDEEGKVMERKSQMSFCRCGHSKNLPYCDGSHKAFIVL